MLESVRWIIYLNLVNAFYFQYLMSVRSKLKFRCPRSIVEHVGVHSMFKEWCWFAIKWCKSHHYNFSGSGMGKQIYYYFLEYLVRMFTNPCYVLAFETLTFNLSSDCTKVRTTWKTHLFSSRFKNSSPTHTKLIIFIQ